MEQQATIHIEGDAQTPQPTTLRRRLGRGLSALLGGRPEDDDSEPFETADAETGSDADVGSETIETSDTSHIPLQAIDRNPFQPRKEFADEALQELAESIAQHGMLQPLLVRPQSGRFQLVAGERRWLAAGRAGIDRVPCRVLELDDRQVYEVAIEENVKRKDLGVLEKAEAFRDYLQRFDCSIEELAGRLSMSRANVSNYLRLLELSEPVKQALSEERISNGHARALLSLAPDDQAALCERIIAESLSVRKTEEAVKQRQRAEAEEAQHSDGNLSSEATGADNGGSSPPPQNGLTSHVLSLREQLQEMLGAKVEIQVKGKEAGKIVIPFASSDEFEGLLQRLRRAA